MIHRFDLNKCLVYYKSGKLDQRIINPASENYVNRWIKFAVELIRLRGGTPSRTLFDFVDRTGSIPSIVKSTGLRDHLIPTGAPYYSDYLDICLARAQELLSTNKHINVLWSGGLDSTVALFSLIRQARNLDQLSVVCTFESIIESGTMFDQIIRPLGIRIKFDQTRCDSTYAYTYDEQDPTQLYVSGQCGDQLFGPAKVFRVVGVKDSDPWANGFSQSFLDIIEPSIKFSTRPIETVRDLRWWVFFNHTWTTVLYDSCVERPPSLGPRIHAFYATDEFQRWAITTPAFYDNTDQYRWPAKHALSQLIDYPYYIQNKTKVLSPTWKKSKKWYLLDEKFNTHYVD